MLFWPGCTVVLLPHFLSIFSGGLQQNQPNYAKKVESFSVSLFSRPPLVDSNVQIFGMFFPFLPFSSPTSHGFLSFFGFTHPAYYTPYTQVSLYGGHNLVLICHFFNTALQVPPIHLSWTFLAVLFLANEKNRTILHNTTALFQKKEDFYLLFYKDVCIIY